MIHQQYRVINRGFQLQNQRSSDYHKRMNNNIKIHQERRKFNEYDHISWYGLISHKLSICNTIDQYNEIAEEYNINSNKLNDFMYHINKWFINESITPTPNEYRDKILYSLSSILNY